MLLICLQITSKINNFSGEIRITRLFIMFARRPIDIQVTSIIYWPICIYCVHVLCVVAATAIQVAFAVTEARNSNVIASVASIATVMGLVVLVTIDMLAIKSSAMLLLRNLHQIIAVR